jgi:hypothetical protein
MILKIENLNKNGYFYFEADEFEYFSNTIQNIKKMDLKNIGWFMKNDKKEDKEDKEVLLFFLYAENRINYKAIVTDRICYVMSSNGKTIERIG